MKTWMFCLLAGLTTVATADVKSGVGAVPEGFVFVEAGTAAGGSPKIKEDFYIAKYEVTNEQMREVLQWAYDQGGLITASDSSVRNAQGDQQELLYLDDSDCQISWKDSSFVVDSGKENYPCVNVTWYGGAAYCNFLSVKEGRAPAYDLSTWELTDGANAYRLPSDVQWEFAARGGKDGSDTEYSGSDNIDEVAWHWYNSDAKGNSGFRKGHGMMPVGTKAANELGTHDMSGNVWEWCHDWESGYEGSYRVLRGGGWISSFASFCRVSHRLMNVPGYNSGYYGFRPVLPAVQQ
jgi:formylglycine-generating enzyme required for sulfatase activity